MLVVGLILVKQKINIFFTNIIQFLQVDNILLKIYLCKD